MIKHICNRCGREQTWVTSAAPVRGEPVVQPDGPIPKPEELCFQCIEDLSALSRAAYEMAEQVIMDWTNERGAAVSSVEVAISRIDDLKKAGVLSNPTQPVSG